MDPNGRMTISHRRARGPSGCCCGRRPPAGRSRCMYVAALDVCFHVFFYAASRAPAATWHGSDRWLLKDATRPSPGTGLGCNDGTQHARQSFLPLVAFVGFPVETGRKKEAARKVSSRTTRTKSVRCASRRVSSSRGPVLSRVAQIQAHTREAESDWQSGTNRQRQTSTRVAALHCR